MYELVSVREQVRWQKILDLFPISDIYYTAQYFLSAIKLDPGEPLLFYYIDDEGEVAYPFIKRMMNEEDSAYFDITTPFGYGGPLLKVKGDAAKLVDNFRDSFTRFCSDENIVVEFIRFHPVINNAAFFENHVTLYPMYATFTLDLKQLLQKHELGKNTEQQNLQKSSSQVIIKKLGTVRHMFDFLVLYYSAARRREEADSYYFFTDDYFEALISSLGPNLHLFGAYYEEKLVSACYVLAMGDTIFHHLEGSIGGQGDGVARKSLLLKVAEWGEENYFSYLHLGGDFLDNAEFNKDTNIKQEISNMEPSTFFIGQYVHDVSAYNRLVSSRETDLVKRYRYG